MKIRQLIHCLSIVTLASLAVVSGAVSCIAAEKAGDVVFVRGKAMIERKAGTIDAAVKAALVESDNISTRDKSRIKMLFRDDSILTLGANSRLVIRKYLYSPESQRAESIYELADGRLRSVVGSSGFKVTTPTAFAAARGTVFTISYNRETGTTEITVLEGSVEVRNINAEIAGTQVVTAGQSTSVSGDKPPTMPMPVSTQGGGAGVDDSASAAAPQLVTPAPPTLQIINDLHNGSGKGLLLTPPFEQVQAHTTTILNIVFP